jgi:DNA polymerase
MGIEMSDTNGLSKIVKIEQLWATCSRCELAKSGRTHVVIGEGDIEPDLVVIGEAPGEEEDRTGFPFVGPSGKELRAMIAGVVYAGRPEPKVGEVTSVVNHEGAEQIPGVYITNRVACRPPGNRDPSPEELSICQARLVSLLWALQPKALLLVGRVAAGLAGIRQIKQWRGELVDVEVPWKRGEPLQWPAIATYPAYYLRGGRLDEVREQMIADITTAWRIARGED